MPVSWVARLMDSGLMAWRRENANRVSRQTGSARHGAPHATEDGSALLCGDVAVEQFQAVREYRQQIVEVVCDTARQLADRLELLRVAQCLLGAA